MLISMYTWNGGKKSNTVLSASVLKKAPKKLFFRKELFRTIELASSTKEPISLRIELAATRRIMNELLCLVTSLHLIV